MSVIIKRGTIIPTTNSKTYYTAIDNQKKMTINIYEGEKRFVNKNHLLRKYNIEELKKRKKGETKVTVTFDIDINGILTVKGKEESEKNDGQSFELVIKNDDINLTEKEIKKLENENKKLFEQMNKEEKYKNKNNIKFILKKYKDAYEKCKNNNPNDEKLIKYITNYNKTLEEFVNKFNKDFDNETIFEKFYLYIKELFLSYIETLQLGLNDGAKNQIFEKIKKYITLFINKSTGYLNSLLEILEDLTKKNMEVNFYNIVIVVIENLNNNGRTCLFSNKKFCKYHSLMYFEQAKSYYEKYFSNGNEEALLPGNDLNSIEEQKKIFSDNIKNINSKAIISCLNSFKMGELYNVEEIKSLGTGFTCDLKKFGINNIQDQIENLKLILDNYVNLLSSIQNDKNFIKNEAICLACIIKLNIKLGYLEYKRKTLSSYVERCDALIRKLTKIENEKWYKEYIKIRNENFKDQDIEVYQDILNRTKRNNSKIFIEIDKVFNKKTKEEFIDYILENHPYKDYSNEIKKPYNLETIRILLEKYHDNSNLIPKFKNEFEELNYCTMQEIAKKLTILYKKVD